MSRKYDFNDVYEVLAYIAIISAIVVACIYGIYCAYKLPKNTIRDWTNTALRHGYCWVRMCDEFHRCPVWDDRQDRCVFLPVDKPKITTTEEIDESLKEFLKEDGF